MYSKTGKNSDIIIYLLCSAVVAAAAAFYFYVTDMKDNTATIVIDKTAPTTLEATELRTGLVTTNASTAKTVSSIPESTATTALTTEFVYIDINSASFDELVKLDGIGGALAKAIIRYREEHGEFRNIEEIMEVSGIGETIFGNICSHIFVVSPVYDNEEAVEDSPDTEPPTEHQFDLSELAPINLNTADIPELMLLPHVDEETARQIIALREDIRGFGNTYELAYVENLSKSQVNDILPYVTVE